MKYLLRAFFSGVYPKGVRKAQYVAVAVFAFCEFAVESHERFAWHYPESFLEFAYVAVWVSAGAAFILQFFHKKPDDALPRSGQGE